MPEGAAVALRGFPALYGRPAAPQSRFQTASPNIGTADTGIRIAMFRCWRFQPAGDARGTERESVVSVGRFVRSAPRAGYVQCNKYPDS